MACDSLTRYRCRCTLYFFFQAEDGIRDSSVTGVQTCALPILRDRIAEQLARDIDAARWLPGEQLPGERVLAQRLGVSRPVVREALRIIEGARSEERRVGKECRSRWSPYH